MPASEISRVIVRGGGGRRGLFATGTVASWTFEYSLCAVVSRVHFSVMSFPKHDLSLGRRHLKSPNTRGYHVAENSVMQGVSRVVDLRDEKD